ncbi:MAG: hypothetical protein ACM3ML_19995 [Micromonosporaceae bacterium]
MFATLQDRLPKELEDAAVTTLEAANAFLRETYLPAHNRRFAVDPEQEGSAFVPWTGGDPGEILCHQEDRVVAKDNTVRFEGLVLQIPSSPIRHHFVKILVQVRRYPDGRLGLFHGPRCIGRYAADGSPADEAPNQAAA